MSITENELAEQVTAIYHEGSDLEAIMRNIARRAAELLGVTLAPEKPAPGTWHIVDAGGYKGRPAHVAYSGCLMVYINDAGETYTFAKSEKWPALTPARVVSEDGLAVIQQTVHDLRRELDEARDFQRTLQREKDEWEANAEEASREIERLTAPVVPAEPVELSESEAREVFNDYQEEAGFMARWGNYTDEARNLYRQIMNAALAKYGRGGRTVNRGDVRRAVDGAVNNAAGITERERITDAVMDLLGGGDDD